MKKIFKGPDRFKDEMEWEAKHKGEFVIKALESHNGKITVFYIGKDEEDVPDE
jgi:hypothetical protein